MGLVKLADSAEAAETAEAPAGAARVAALARQSGAVHLTRAGFAMGTPSYMSPEQAQGARVGPASDVFSLGCVIVFAATGRGPFGGGPQASMLYRVVHAEPALDEVPGGLRELAAACLAKAPAARPGLAALVEATAAGRAPDEGDALDTASRLVRNRMYWEGSQIDRPNERPFALHRNGYAGMQRYGSFLWSGDVNSLWETLRNHVPVGVADALQRNERVIL